jgi:Oxidoreductase family, NAD-binding Rossmann fold
MNSNEKSRRSFLKNALALSAASAIAPSIWNNVSALGTSGFGKAGEKVNLACIGIGNQGGSDVMSLYNTGLCNLVAFCDVDMGAPQTLEVLKKFPDVPRFQDFRKMFDKMGNQIEAVSVGVPDHAHFPITMMALGLGKHVFVETQASQSGYTNGKSRAF